MAPAGRLGAVGGSTQQGTPAFGPRSARGVLPRLCGGVGRACVRAARRVGSTRPCRANAPRQTIPPRREDARTYAHTDTRRTDRAYGIHASWTHVPTWGPVFIFLSSHSLPHHAGIKSPRVKQNYESQMAYPARKLIKRCLAMRALCAAAGVISSTQGPTNCFARLAPPAPVENVNIQYTHPFSRISAPAFRRGSHYKAESWYPLSDLLAGWQSQSGVPYGPARVYMAPSTRRPANTALSSALGVNFALIQRAPRGRLMVPEKKKTLGKRKTSSHI